jgi:hypothetical protein
MGYVFVARKYMPARAKGQIDRIGYDGGDAAFCGSADADRAPGNDGVAQLGVTEEMQKLVARTAKVFLLEPRAKEYSYRLGVPAIDNEARQARVVRLGQDAFPATRKRYNRRRFGARSAPRALTIKSICCGSAARGHVRQRF